MTSLWYICKEDEPLWSRPHHLVYWIPPTSLLLPLNLSNLPCAFLFPAPSFYHTSVSCSVMSISLWPHGLYSATLLCPLDSPGKNIGEGDHSLLIINFHSSSNVSLPVCKFDTPIYYLVSYLCSALFPGPWYSLEIHSRVFLPEYFKCK